MNRAPKQAKLHQSAFKQSARAAGCLFLAGWVLLLTLAAANPALHGWLHGAGSEATSCQASGHSHSSSENTDSSDAPAGGAHFCGVTALHSFGLLVSFFSASYQPLELADVPLEFGPRVTFVIFIKSAPARAPPIEVIV